MVLFVVVIVVSNVITAQLNSLYYFSGHCQCFAVSHLFLYHKLLRARV